MINYYLFKRRVMSTEFGIAKFIVYTTLKNKRMSQTEIEIRLKNRNTILPTVLTLLTIVMTIIIYISSQSNNALNIRYNTTTTRINQLENIGIKGVDYEPQAKRKTELTKITNQISSIQEEMTTDYNTNVKKLSDIFASMVVVIVFALILLSFSMMYQVLVTRELYKKLTPLEINN